jgi:hypothetical protein
MTTYFNHPFDFMKIEVDHNKLLVIENENIPQTKEYTYNVWWYHFSDYDKWIIVLHKKDFKIVNLKNLGDNMSVVYYKENVVANVQFNQVAFEDALKAFQGFDETTGEKYFFIPSLWESEKQEKNAVLKKFGKCEIKKNQRGMVVELQNEAQDKPDTKDRTWIALSFLFGLLCLYGKFDSKNGELSSIKIQLPLFGQYLKQQETLDTMIQSLQKDW